VSGSNDATFFRKKARLKRGALLLAFFIFDLNVFHFLFGSVRKRISKCRRDNYLSIFRVLIKKLKKKCFWTKKISPEIFFL
jgi:hypothetical protein